MAFTDITSIGYGGFGGSNFGGAYYAKGSHVDQVLIDNLSGINELSAIVLIQNYLLVVANLSGINVLENLTLVQNYTLSINNLSGVNELGSPSITQELAVSNLSGINVVENITLTQNILLTVANLQNDNVLTTVVIAPQLMIDSITVVNHLDNIQEPIKIYVPDFRQTGNYGENITPDSHIYVNAFKNSGILESIIKTILTGEDGYWFLDEQEENLIEAEKPEPNPNNPGRYKPTIITRGKL